MAAHSPFRISQKDVKNLERNDAFRLIREHLRRQELGMDAPSFCSSHRYSCPPEEQEVFRLHRDVIHTILLPLFILHNQASRIASNVLPSDKGTETERAFRGEARSAYAWLHCILTEEHDWYLTERCPACIVLHVLHSEPTIRFVAVACLLSDHLLGLGLLNSSRRLPSFDFWFETLEAAVREDPFWGEDCWPGIEYRACSLTDGVKQLALQCLELQTSLDRQNLQSIASFKTNPRFRCDSSQSLPIRPTDTDSSDCAQQPVMSAEEHKSYTKLVANRCVQSLWNDRPRRFHSRRNVDSRRRSVTS